MDTAGQYELAFFEPIGEIDATTSERFSNETLQVASRPEYDNSRKRSRPSTESAQVRGLRQRHTLAITQLQKETDEAAHLSEILSDMMEETFQNVTKFQRHLKEVQRLKEHLASNWIDIEAYTCATRAAKKVRKQYMSLQEYLESLKKAERLLKSILDHKKGLLASRRSTPATSGSIPRSIAIWTNLRAMNTALKTPTDAGRVQQLYDACEQIRANIAEKKRHIANIETLIASTKANTDSIKSSVRECREFLSNCKVGVLTINPKLGTETNATLEGALCQQRDLEEFLTCLEKAKFIASRSLQELESSQTEIAKSIPEPNYSVSTPISSDPSPQRSRDITTSARSSSSRTHGETLQCWSLTRNKLRDNVRGLMRRIALEEGWTTKCVCTTRCDAECLNRYTAIECSVENCNLGNTDCGNRQFLLGPSYQEDLEVIQAGRKGLGLGTTKRLEPSQLVVTYRGEVIDGKTMKERMARYRAIGHKNFYMMHLRRGLYIDATSMGSLARFVNHSCKPNCELIPWIVGLELELGIFAGDEPIEPGTEITICYGFDNSDDRCPCYCGVEGCGGFMGGGGSGQDTV